MQDEVYLGPVPNDEDCAQVGTNDYSSRSRKECQAYINQLLRQFGEPPTGSRFSVKACPHDFGTYHEVVVKFDDSDEDAETFAYKVENEANGEWDREAIEELLKQGIKVTRIG